MYLDSANSVHVSLPLIFGGVIGIWLASVVFQAIYNVTFHPLAKFPGPKLRGASELVDAIGLILGYRDKQIVRLHEKYGPVVRVSPRQLSFTTAQAWKDIYGFRAGKGGEITKDGEFYFVDKSEGLPANIIASDRDSHAKTRRLLSHAFSDNALRGQEDILNHYFELLVDRLHEQVDGPNAGRVNMVGWLNYTTFDVIGDLAFGEPFHALENRDYHPWISNIFGSIKFRRWIRLGALYPWFGKAFKTAAGFFPSIRRSRNVHLDFAHSQTEARLNRETDRKDFITYIQQGKNGGELDHKEIVTNMSVLVVAGSETTATLLSGLTYHLLRNPDKLAKLQAEVRGAFSSPDEMDLVAVGKLPYVQAALDEGLRMYPPVPTLMPRRLGAEGAMVDGHYVPPHTQLGVHQLSAYRSPANWADPDTFDPARFLPAADVPERYVHDQRDALQPFSTGPRNCIGKNLAYNEMRAILVRLIWHFDMELLPESQHWADQKTWTLWQKPELWVRLSRRPLKSE